ncbi:MAG: hypothetical protein Fur0041_19600 [Bacteroidia bacterium]
MSVMLMPYRTVAQNERFKADSLTQILKKNPEDRKARKSYILQVRKINADSALQICISNAEKAERAKNITAAGDWNYFAGVTLDNMQRNKDAVPFFKKSIDQLKSVRDTFNLDDCQNTLGYVLLRMGEYRDGLKYMQEALAFREFTNDTMGKATTLLNMGLLYNNMGDYTQALDHYFKCLEYARMFEEKDPSLMGKVMNNIGSVYMNQKKFDDALKFFRQSIYFKEKAGNKKDLASTYNNIGSLYIEKNLDSSLYYFNRSLALREEAGDKRGLGIVHKNIGEVYQQQKKYKEAEKEYLLSLDFREQINDQTGIASSLIALGSLQNETGNSQKALFFLIRGDSIARATESLSQQFDASLELSKAYRNLGKYNEALKYADLALELKDSLLNEASARHSEEMRTRYDMERQTKELEQLKMQQREDALKADSEKAFYKLMIGAGIIVMILIVSFFIIRQRENRKAQHRLQMAYDQIEMKNKDITDSIRYAKRIQQAILPEDDAFKSAFPDSFVMYRPKDIVSGDFYWYHQSGNIRLVAVGDCTGHGVPGAFMSVLCSSQLTAVSTEQENISPSSILHEIDKGIKRQLHQDMHSSAHDSMDIALCAWNPEKRELIYSGANRPLIIYREKGGFEVIKPSKFSVGGETDRDKNFTEHRVILEKGDVFYLFSDGFADQFGGPKGKKFKSSQFKSVLTDIASHNTDLQGQELSDIFDRWKNGFEQVDDICVIGIRV